MLQDFFESCVKIKWVQTADGMGGVVDSFTDDEQFLAAISTDSQNEVMSADKLSIKKLYTVVVNKDVKLNENDRIKREKTGEMLRITSDIDERETPWFSGMNCRAYGAEVVK